MVVGQDWADVSIYLKEGSNEDDSNPINKNLITLLNSIGVTAKPPSFKEKNRDLFFTNAILCLKEGEEKMQAPTLEEWYYTCGRYFLRPLIELVQPEAVIALGLMATNGILHSYGKKLYSVLRKAVECPDGIQLSEKIRLFPEYHCGNKGVHFNRDMEHQLMDWKKIERYLRTMDMMPGPRVQR